MSLSVQNLRAIGPGVEPNSLLPGQIAFNVTDKVLYVGDGSSFKTQFDGTQVAGVTGEGWYAMPMDFGALGSYYVANPEFYGDIPTDQQVLTWSGALNHPIWTSNIGGDNQVYVITNNDVAIAPGATVSDKITAAIGVVSPDEGDVTIVTGLPDEVYEGLYFYTTEWVKGAAYAYPSATEVIYNNTGRTLGATVQLAIDDLDDGLIATTAIANTANSTANSALSIASAALPRAGGTMTGPIRLNSILVDGAGSPGTVDQVLVSTATGVQWVSNAPGDVTGVTGTAPITVDNTDPQNPVVGVSNATTSSTGVVQLNDTTASTSTTEAATANAVKTAYDLADAALPKATYTTKGDLVVGGTAGVPTRLPVSTTDGYTLVANSAASLGVEWAANNIFYHTVYANAGATTLQATIDSVPTAGYVVETSPGIFAENVIINRDSASGNGSIKINGPFAPNYYSSTNINSITITGSTANFVTLTNLNVIGTLEINGTLGGHSLSNVAMQDLVVSGTSSGNLNVEYCNITGSVTIPATYTGLLIFNGCNFQGATITSNAISPTYVIFTNCVGLPSLVIPNVTLLGSNSDVSFNVQVAASQFLQGASNIGNLAIAALPKTGGTMTGAITFVAGQTFPVSGIQDATTTQKGVVQVGTNIDVSSGTISVANSSTSGKGVVQLNDTVVSTSTTEAATANAVRVTKDVADAAVPRSSYVADGDILVGTGVGTFGPLSVGTDGQILTIISGTPAWADDAPGDVTSVTGTAPITVDNTDPQTPIVSVELATTATPGVVQIELTGNLTNVGGVINVPDASTTVKGAVSLNNTLSSTSTSEALTAAQGKALQDQIDALTLSNSVILAGGYNATTGLVDGVTSQGTLAGFTDGAAPPTAAAANVDHYLIATTSGSVPSAMENGDWLLSIETSPGVYAYQVLGVGARPASASYTTAGIVQLADAASVLAGTSDTTAITPQALQDNVLDSVTTVNSSQIASSTAVKTAYDAGILGQTEALAAQTTANAALPKAGGTMSGTLISQNINVLGSHSIQFAGGINGNVDAISDSTSTTSSTTAASATAVKSAYDLANAAIPNSVFNAKGDIIVGTGNDTYGNLFVGTNGQILVADSAEVFGVKWIAPPPDGVLSLTGTSPITVDNTDPANPVVGINSASTTGAGAVQLNDTVTSTSITQAATANAVKSAYDLANAALPKAGGTMTGNVTFQDAGEGVVFNGGSSIYAISDSVSLTSSTTAASSTAVKAVAQAGLYLPLATATTIYVNGTNGNDATGLRGTNQAFKTITAALAASFDDDTIFIGPATYTEDIVINKSVNLEGTFRDQALDAGPVIVGTTTLTLTPIDTHAAAISNLYFRAASPSNDTFVVTDNSFSIGGNTVITNCTFASASGHGTGVYCLSMTGTWTRSLYFRECSFQANIQMAAGTVTGTGAYAVIDNYLGLGQTNNYIRMTSGTLEIRHSSQALSPVFQTGGSLLLSEINGWSSSDATLNPVFTTTGWAYKGTSTGLGNCIFQITGGSNIVASGSTFGSVSIGTNVIYTLENVSWDTTKVTNTGVPITAVVPNPNVVNATQARFSYETLKTTSTVTAANQLATVLDSTTGTMYSVAAFDAGTY